MLDRNDERGRGDDDQRDAGQFGRIKGGALDE